MAYPPSCCIVSIDIGISNMAYCILQKEPVGGVKIGAWRNVNLKEDEADPAAEQEVNASSAEKRFCCRCRKRAVFEQQSHPSSATTTTVCFCAAHANDNIGPFCVLPSGWRHSAQWLAKKKKTDLHEIEASLRAALSRSPTSTTTTSAMCDNSKNSYIASIMALSPIHGLTKIVSAVKRKKKQQPGGRTADYVRIGRNMKRLFDETMSQLLNDNVLTHVVIETQMTAKMKTVQGMVMQYFIMRSSPCLHVEFVSPVHKLKTTTTTTTTNDNTPHPTAITAAPAIVASSRYRQNKLDGVSRCYDLIADENNQIRFSDGGDSSVWEQMQQQQLVLHGGGKKKIKLDDFADAFLQGWWYLTSSPNCRTSKA